MTASQETALSPAVRGWFLGPGGRIPGVAFDDLKEFGGKVYSGMPVGGGHTWKYTDGVWRERKTAPDRWEFTFSSLKRRIREAPEGSGVLVGTGYHWFIVAHQRVRKLDKDSYETAMEGVKYKVAHRRPYWRHWSTEYPDQEPEKEVLIRILEEYLAELKSGTDPPPDGRPGSPAITSLRGCSQSVDTRGAPNPVQGHQ